MGRLAPVERDCRIAIIGVGQDLCGDDAVGLRVVRRLKEELSYRDSILVIEGGSAPENVVGVVRRFRPDLVLLVDAGWLNLAPGEARLITPEQAAQSSATTHTLSLAVLAEFLQIDMGCEVAVLVVQVQDVQFGALVSRAVELGAAHVVQGLSTILASCRQPS